MHRLRACAGSWMSRTTTVGSPTTVPMTRLSPAGTADAQWTIEVATAGGLAAGDALVPAGAEAAADADGGAVVCAIGVEPPHAASAVAMTRTAARPRTR
ncbi:MAG: hypothetical protein E6I72_02750 [Chloroflexi bacterium]|nr:MAG: hypothetical protein E6I72_02750 [Chloroflexota bacterium]